MSSEKLEDYPIWEDRVIEIKEGEEHLRGKDAPINIQARMLANRTRWLKENQNNFSTGTSVIADPIINVVGDPSKTTKTPLFYTSSFTVNIGSDVHVSTDWIITDNNDNIIYQSLQDNINKLNLQIPENILSEGVTYKIKVRHNGGTSSSNFSTLIFTVSSIELKTPEVIAVSSDKDNGLYIVSSDLYYLYGTAIHQSTDWIIEDLNGSLIWSSLNDTTNLTNITLQEGILDYGVNYRIKVRYLTDKGYTPYGSSIFISTEVKFENPSITEIDLVPNNLSAPFIVKTSPLQFLVGTANHLSTDWTLTDTYNNIIVDNENDSSSPTIYTPVNYTPDLYTVYNIKFKYNTDYGSTNEINKDFLFRKNSLLDLNQFERCYHQGNYIVAEDIEKMFMIGVRSKKPGNGTDYNNNLLIYNHANKTLYYGRLDPTFKSYFCHASRVGSLNKALWGGGYQQYNHSYSKRNYIMDFDTLISTRVSDSPIRLRQAIGFSDPNDNSKVYVIGGRKSGSTYNKTILIYDYDLDQWSQTQNIILRYQDNTTENLTRLYHNCKIVPNIQGDGFLFFGVVVNNRTNKRYILEWKKNTNELIVLKDYNRYIYSENNSCFYLGNGYFMVFSTSKSFLYNYYTNSINYNVIFKDGNVNNYRGFSSCAIYTDSSNKRFYIVGGYFYRDNQYGGNGYNFKVLEYVA